MLRFFWFLFFLNHLSLCAVQKLGILFDQSSVNNYISDFYGTIVNLAIQEADSIDGVTFETVVKDTKSAVQGTAIAANSAADEGARVFIGASKHFPSASAIANVYGIPIFWATPLPSANPAEYPLACNLMHPVDDEPLAALRLMSSYQWNQFSLVLSTSFSATYFGLSLNAILQDPNSPSVEVTMVGEEYSDKKFEEVLQNLRNDSPRIVLFYGNTTLAARIMNKIVDYKLDFNSSGFTWILSGEISPMALEQAVTDRNVLTGVIILTPYQDESSIRYNNIKSHFGLDFVDPYFSLVYDMVFLATRMFRSNAVDGVELIANIKDFTFKGATGSVEVNDFCRRQDSKVGIVNFSSDEASFVGFYDVSSDRLELNSSMVWGDGTKNVPLDHLPEDSDSSNLLLILGIGGTLTIILVIIALLLISNRRKRRVDMTCAISMKEIKRGKLIGKGGYGKVYKAIYRQKSVALKILHKSLGGEALEEFKREVQMNIRLRHPNVVLFMGACLEGEELAIVTEYMSRHSLFDVLHGNEPDQCLKEWNTRVTMALDIGEGLCFLHGSSIVHRDLKSPNVLVNEHFNSKVADFGLAKVKSKLRNHVNAIGNPVWSAPEVFTGGPLTEKMDVYSFAIVMCELITMSIPFYGMDPKALPLQVVKDIRPRIPDAVPSNLSTMLRECWDKDPTKRPDMMTVVQILRSCVIDEESMQLGLQDFTQSQYVPHVFGEQTAVKAVNNSTPHADSQLPELPSVSLGLERHGKLVWDFDPAVDLQIGTKLGEGMSAEVYKAVFRGEVVAVKKIFIGQKSERQLQTFFKETKLMKALRHENVIGLMACCVVDPHAFIVTEFMPRGSIYDMYTKNSKNRPNSMSRIQMCLHIAQGVAYLHSKNVIHRDIKSPNVMVTKDWVAKIGDFGLSRIADNHKTMTVCGSPLWTSPEMLFGHRYNEKADVYSFAIIMWELLAWCEPFPQMRVIEVVTAVAEKKERPTLKKEWPSGFVKIMKQCWAQEPESRPTMNDVVSMLKIFIADYKSDRNSNMTKSTLAMSS
eukprot:TRINITY_DN779867_c0_g1_i1.p1 TRINITY_DN779867_c0_g1~~TRINITY_DN779867_c0_g1_i1.p1  ORF type:complete len:1036 (+),score=202.55 TRINITY_DN779867_c0_g1_i1:96-3203(+)